MQATEKIGSPYWFLNLSSGDYQIHVYSEAF